MKKKNILIVSLATASLVCSTFALAACGGVSKKDLKAEFKADAPTELIIGKEYDFDDFIVRVDGASCEMTLEYSTMMDGDITESYSGYDTVFYAKTSGEHKLTYTVSSGKNSVSNSMELTAKEASPTVSFTRGEQAYPVQLNRKIKKTKVLFSSMLDYIGTSLTPIADVNNVQVTEGYRVDYVEGNDEYDKYNFTEKVTVKPGAVNFEFSSENGGYGAGLYRFKAEYTTTGGTASKYFYALVSVGESAKAYKANVKEDGTVTLKPGRYKRMAGAWTTDYSYYGLGMYEAGDTLEMTFTGQNIPNIGLFTDVPSGQPIGGGSGLFIQTSNNSVGVSKRLMICGPDRMETGKMADYEAGGIRERAGGYDKYDMGKNGMIAQDIDTNKSVEKNTSKFGLMSLDANAQYRLVIKTQEESSTTVKLTLELYKNGVEDASVSYTLEHKLPSLSGTYAVAYSAGSGAGKAVSFKYQISTTRRTADGRSLGETALYRNSDTQEVHLTGAATPAYYTVGSMALKDTFKTTFYGKNVPEVMLFADNTDGKTNAGNGVYFTVDVDGTKIYNARKTGTPVSVVNSLSTADLTEGQEYLYTIAQQKVGSNLKFTVNVHEYNSITGTVGTLVKSYESGNIAFDISANNGKYAVIVGKGEGIETICAPSIMVYVPEGQITLKKGTENHSASNNPYTNWTYTATPKITLNQKLVVKFSGKNIPNVVYLADSNEGQAYGGGKGYALIAAQNAGANPNAEPPIPAGRRFYASGPNRAALDGNGFFGRGTADWKIDSTGNDACAYANLDWNEWYELCIWAEKLSSGVSINYVLTTEGGVEVYKRVDQHATDDYAKSLYQNATDGYHAILYGNVFQDVSFTYEIETYDPMAEFIAINQENISTLLNATAGKYKLTSDINMSGVTLGSSTFTGVLDGQGHTISNLTTSGSAGLFAASSGVIRNVAFKNVTIGSSAGSGGTIAKTISGGEIENVVIQVNTAMVAGGQYNGLVCALIHGSFTASNLVVYGEGVRYNASAKYQQGFITGRTKIGCTVTANNCYFITTNQLTPSGVLEGTTGAYLFDAASKAEALTETTQYDKVFAAGSTYKIYTDASLANALTAYKADNTVTLNTTVQTMWNSLFPTT